MTYQEITGDLFTVATTHPLAALGHGVNCHGVMGSGIAPTFKRRYPDMYRAYRNACRTGDLTVGGMFPWTATDGLTIYNLATQHRPGPDARLAAIETALAAALDHATAHNIPSLGLPRIGAGIGGLNWTDVRAVITALATPSPVEVVVVTLPTQAGPR